MTEPTPETIRQIIDNHLRAENAGDLEGTIATLAEDCIFDSVPRGQRFVGHAGARRLYAGTFAAFPDWHVEITSFTPGQDHAWCEAVVTATHLGEFDGVPATGRRITFPLAVKFRIHDGRLGGEVLYFDRLTILEQIGGAPGR